jgi:Family of unknown function (DUF6056)
MKKIYLKILKLKIYQIFSVLGILSLFPLFCLSFFNNPGSDDFDMAADSLAEPLLQLQFSRYNNWSGRYFSNGLISFEPLFYNNFFMIKIVPIILMILFVFAVYVFISSLQLFDLLKHKIAIIGLIVFIYIYQMPYVCEGFYWIPGSITNFLPVILSLFYFSFLITFFRTNKIIFYLIAIVFLVATIGCNEVSVVILGFIHLILIGYNYFVFKKTNKSILILFLISLIFSAIELLAPGNAVRANLIIEKHNLIFSILKSIQFEFIYVFKWLPIIALCFLFSINYIVSFIKITNKKYFINPIFSILIILSLVFIGVFPGFWSLNSQPPNRSLNTLYFYFVVTTIYFLITIVNYLIEVKNIDFSLPKNIQITLGCIILSMFLSTNNIMTAYQDLFSLKAFKYNNEMKARFLAIDNCKETDCVLKQLINKPTTIFSQEDFALTTDKNNWKNLEIARYYRKNSIVIESNEKFFTE